MLVAAVDPTGPRDDSPAGWLRAEAESLAVAEAKAREDAIYTRPDSCGEYEVDSEVWGLGLTYEQKKKLCEDELDAAEEEESRKKRGLIA